MKYLTQLEELAMFVLSIYAFTFLHYQWWWFLVLILLPDIGMIGYIINNKIGAYTYNLMHHKAIAIIIYTVGLSTKNEFIQLVGIILFAHASMDRVFGYGLKYEKGFKFTHLGTIGK
jgi:hypothetical protein